MGKADRNADSTPQAQGKRISAGNRMARNNNATKAQQDGTTVEPIRTKRRQQYSDKIAEAICDQLTEGKSLNQICRDDPTLPSERTVRRWIRDESHPLSQPYARAREIGLEKIGDDVIALADKANPDNYNAIRLQIDARKWFLSKVAPKTFGDKAHHTIDTQVVHSVAMPDDNELTRILAAAINDASQQAPVLLECLSDTGQSSTV